MKLMFNDTEVFGVAAGIPVVEITQEEYEALTDDERNAEILYLVVDPEPEEEEGS